MQGRHPVTRRARKQRAVACDYCGQPAAYLPSSAALYASGKDYGPAWACMPCGAWVGCHKGTDRPLGRLANADLRRLKIAAHAAFDPLWRRGLFDRGGAYAWLSDQMGLDIKDTHIGMFNEDQCVRVIQASDWFIDGRRAA